MGVKKTPQKGSKKMSEISLFEGRATNNNFYFLLDTEFFFQRMPSTSLYQSYSQHTQISFVHFEYIIYGINQT
jgi:hypothetical protein